MRGQKQRSLLPLFDKVKQQKKSRKGDEERGETAKASETRDFESDA